MDADTVIGVDLGGTNVRVGRVRNNEIMNYASRSISSQKEEDVVLQEIIETINAVFDGNVRGIGIGVPSLVDVDRGIVYTVENIPSWKEVHLKDILQNQYGIPVYVNNDANAFALGECYFGKGQKYNNIVAITVGTGIGSGIVINRRLYSGSNCGAGEIGMIPYLKSILEHYCSGQFFKREFGISGDIFFQRAQDGDKTALKVFKDFGSHMGNAVMIVLYAFDPDIIVFGGSVSKGYSFFKDSMMKKLDSFAYKHVLNRVVIDCSDMKDIALLGAAALYFDAHH